MKNVATFLLGLLVFSASVAAEEKQAAHADLPHSFLLPKSIPDRVGSYHVQVTPFLEMRDGVGTGDVGGHLSVGMFEWGGIHARSLGVKTSSNTELIGMVNIVRDESGRGVSALGIVGIPTKKKPGDEHNHGLNYLFGVTVRPIAGEASSLDINLHYDFTAKHLISEAGYVVKLSDQFYSAMDSRGTIGSATEVDLLPGIKYRIPSIGFVGLGYRFPVTSAKAFDSQVLMQLEVGKH